MAQPPPSPRKRKGGGGGGVQTMLFPKFSNRKSTDVKDTLSWNISHVVMKIVPISKKIVISFAMERGIPFWVLRKFKENWENNMTRVPNTGKASMEQIVGKRQKSKSQNWCFKKTKHAKFSEKRAFLAPWYAHFRG